MITEIDPTKTVLDIFEENTQKFIDDNQLKIGDKVKLTRKAVYQEQGWNNVWVGEMTTNLNKVGTITDFGSNGEGIEVGFPNEMEPYFQYPFFTLEKV